MHGLITFAKANKLRSLVSFDPLISLGVVSGSTWLTTPWVQDFSFGELRIYNKSNPRYLIFNDLAGAEFEFGSNCFTFVSKSSTATALARWSGERWEYFSVTFTVLRNLTSSPLLSAMTESTRSIEHLVKRELKLSELNKKYVEEFISQNPITGKHGETLTARARQLGIDQ